MDFWQRIDALLDEHEIVIDRPKGSRHPRFPQIVFPLDYGYLKGTSGGDGKEIDVWKGSLKGNPLKGVICTVDSLKKDAELKLLIGCTEDEIEIVDKFYKFNESLSGWVVRRKN
jgi:inorganic pyrophosphatase